MNDELEIKNDELMELIKLKELVTYRKQFIEIREDKKYKRCRVQLHRRGVKLRDEVFGHQIKTKKQRLCKADDFIVAEMDAKFGGYGMIPDYLEDAIVSSHYYLYELKKDRLLPMFLDVIIDSGVFQEQIKAVGSTNYSRVSAKEVLEYEVTCPSLQKQQEIVDHYFQCKRNATELKTELTHQQTLLKKLRQQILQEAIEGKLTADWRKQNPDVEPARELLKRIQAEKAQLIKDKKIKKQKPMPPISEDEKPFELPDGWIWCRLGEFAQITRGKSPKYSKSGVFKMINQKCVRWFYIDTNHTKSINFKWFEFIDDSFKTMKNDVLVNSTGDGTIGRSAIVGNESIGYLFDSHVLRVKSYQDINQKLICLIINSDFGQDFIEGIKGATSTKQTELGVNNLSNFRFPLPPLPEQKAIVTNVKKLLALCDQLESQITRNQRHAEQLMQAVLIEAFSQQNEITDPSIRQARQVAANV